MKKDIQRLNTQEVIERLGAFYPSPIYGFITQVRSGTGAGNTRTADAMSMCLWPSRGLIIAGFEVKVSRTDWLKELKSPEKAEEIAKFCHEWYLVVGDETIVHEGELPDTWGLIVPDKKGLKIVKKAKHNQHIVPFDNLMLAGIFRNIAEQCIPKETLKTILRTEYERGKESGVWEHGQLKKDFKDMVDAIYAFEKASGVKIKTSSWDKDYNKNIGEAVRLVLDGKDKKSHENLLILKTKVEKVLKFIEGEEISNFEMR